VLESCSVFIQSSFVDHLSVTLPWRQLIIKIFETFVSAVEMREIGLSIMAGKLLWKKHGFQVCRLVKNLISILYNALYTNHHRFHKNNIWGCRVQTFFRGKGHTGSSPGVNSLDISSYSKLWICCSVVVAGIMGHFPGSPFKLFGRWKIFILSQNFRPEMQNSGPINYPHFAKIRRKSLLLEICDGLSEFGRKIVFLPICFL